MQGVPEPRELLRGHFGGSSSNVVAASAVHTFVALGDESQRLLSWPLLFLSTASGTTHLKPSDKLSGLSLQASLEVHPALPLELYRRSVWTVRRACCYARGHPQEICRICGISSIYRGKGYSSISTLSSCAAAYKE